MIGLTIAALMIVAVTVQQMHRLRHGHLKAPPTVLLFGLVGLIVVGGVGLYSRAQTQREYDLCAFGVKRSDGNRAQHLAIAQRLEDRGLAEDAEFLRAALAVNLPNRSIGDC